MTVKLAAALVALLIFTPAARAADPATYALDANVNDPGIDTARGQNLVWAPAGGGHRVDKLLVFLPYGGPANLPTEFEEIGAEGARLGYHTIVLAYKNEVPIANASGCGNTRQPPPSPPDCAINGRMEIFDGDGESPVLTVTPANSIRNRLIKVLQYLAANGAATENWGQFLDGAAPKWPEIVISGGSLGAGQSALIGHLFPVHRVALFAGWTDADHGWVSLGATPADRYAALIHARDAFLPRMCEAYRSMGLTPACPQPDFAAPPDAQLVENLDPPFPTGLLVFNLEFGVNFPVAPDPYHASTVRDGFMPQTSDGKPAPKLVNAWRSVLGDSDADTYLDEIDNCPRLASADQTDADGDGLGTPCDPTPRGTTPPVITAAPVTVDATGPAGAPVPFTATAADDLDPAPPVSCAPASGSIFAIGATTVACSASDLGGNTATATFVVTVRGAGAQLARLITKIGGSPALAALVGGLDPTGRSSAWRRA